MPGAELRSVLKPLRRGLILVLVALIFCVTAFAFSSVGHERWHSKLEKGKYKNSVDELNAVEEPESIQPNVYVIVSDPIQIPVNIDGSATNTDEEPIEDEIVGE